MGNKSKIRKYNLEEEALQLKDQGLSLEKVAERLKEDHPQIEDLQSLKGMSVMRFLNSEEENQIVEDYKYGKNPLAESNTKFVKAVEENIKGVKDAMEWALDMKERAITDGDILVETKVLKSYLDTLQQEVSDLVTLKKWGEHQRDRFDKVNNNQLVLVKNLIVSVMAPLCPECKRKVSKELDKYMEK